MTTDCFGSFTQTLERDHVSISVTRHAPALRTPAHAHDTLLLHYVLSGLYQESVRGRSVSLGPGWLLYKPPEQTHWNEFRDGGAVTLRFEFRPTALAGLEAHVPDRLDAVRSPRIAVLGGRVEHELRRPDGLSALVAHSLAYELVAALARMSKSGARGVSEMARRCAEIIDVRFSDPLALGGLAEELGVSRSVLARQFRTVYGLSVGEYLRQRRVSFVADALRGHTSRSLADLALAAGFSDQSHLTRSFKRVYGQPPGAWRRRYRSR